MRTWRKICCAVDFSPASFVALEAAATLARGLGAGLTLLHVEQAPVDSIFASPELAEACRRDREYKLAEWRERAQMLSGSPVPLIVTDGEPAPQIVRVAAAEGFDLIAVGTQGRSGLKRTLLGSVAEAVVRHAHCPVLTLQGAEERPALAMVR